MDAKLVEAEEKSKKAISMAQQGIFCLSAQGYGVELFRLIYYRCTDPCILP